MPNPTLATAVVVATSLVLPFLIRRYLMKLGWASWVGTVAWCYLAGAALANLVPWRVAHSAVDPVMTGALALAVPLALVAMPMGAWRLGVRPVALAYGLLVVGVALTSMLAMVLMAPWLPEPPKLAAMFAGTYTGGSVNLNSLGVALGADPARTITAANLAEVAASALYWLAVLVVAKPVLRRLWPAQPPADPNASPYAEPTKPSLAAHGMAMLAGLLMVGLSLVLAEGLERFLLATNLATAAEWAQWSGAVMLALLTTVALAMAWRGGRQWFPAAGPIADYTLLVFATALGWLVDLQQLMDVAGALFLYASVVLAGGLLVVLVGGRLLRLPLDAVLMASCAGIMSVPFVPPLGTTLQAPQLIVPTTVVAVLGYGLGNYLGLLVYLLMR